MSQSSNLVHLKVELKALTYLIKKKINCLLGKHKIKKCKHKFCIILKFNQFLILLWDDIQPLNTSKAIYWQMSETHLKIGVFNHFGVGPLLFYLFNFFQEALKLKSVMVHIWTQLTLTIVELVPFDLSILFCLCVKHLAGLSRGFDEGTKNRLRTKSHMD
jgi:hypothetical protein